MPRYGATCRPRPADWSEEDTKQDIEEVYGIRIDMMDQYPLCPGPAASPDATMPTVPRRPPVPPAGAQPPRTFHTDHCAEPLVETGAPGPNVPGPGPGGPMERPAQADHAARSPRASDFATQCALQESPGSRSMQ
jgi:hypothetical protein